MKTGFQRKMLAALQKQLDEMISETAALVPDKADGDMPQDEQVARNLAAALDLQYLDHLDAGQLVVREEECLELLKREGPQVWALVDGPSNPPCAVIVPNSRSAAALDGLGPSRHPLKSRVRVATADTVRRALQGRAAGALEAYATRGLFERMPEFSARIRLNSVQGASLGIVAVIMFYALLFDHVTALLAIHVAATIFFVGCFLLRFGAAMYRTPKMRDLPEPRRAEPVYTVLVALWREANMVPQLLAALSRLAWPADKLEIKLVCEADDRETIAAIRSHPLGSMVEIIEVPPSLPRTKPKALRYALPMCRGEFVVLFDAEDIPHPYQLHEAWSVFDRAGPRLGCLQAPLEIINYDRNWISRCFAFEYAALFRGLVPWLASLRLAFPLGGTSNHFRRSALEAVGAWDPHNVTEDADLGIRLARLGYATGVLTRPTYESAPDCWADWFPQRARWNKGWLQTWLVHMRSPVRLARELGFGSFLVAQFVLFGMVFSALVHPLMIISLIYLAVVILAGIPLSTFAGILLAADLASIAGGYAGFFLLGWTRLRADEKAGFATIVASTPLYWLLISVAAWKAVRDLFVNPFHWDKTSHTPYHRQAPRISF